jgi:DNA polymerase-3 subunit gamma/tau
MGEKKNAEKADSRALYRKYRSKSLDEIVGQEHITKTLKQALKSGKISHAYLFTGPRGVGKTSIARIFAHEVNKTPYTDEAADIDIIEIDAASNRRIDDIRDLREKVNLVPVNSKYKVYIIDEVHMLTSESFNALLKTLEEPPEHVIFILATTEFHKLPATIISRTQRHTFKAVPLEQVTKHLDEIAQKENINIESEALELVAEHGEGSFRDSISLLDQVRHIPPPVTKQRVEELLGIAPASETEALLNATKAGDTKLVVEIIDRLSAQGVASTVVVSALLKSLRKQAPTHSLVTLMKDLLNLPSNHNANLALEVALLNYAVSIDDGQIVNLPANDSPKTLASPVTKAVKKDPTPKVERTEAVFKSTGTHKIESNSPQKKAVKQVTPKNNHSTQDVDLDEYWPDILSEIKTRNSSLYTVMRLAKAKLDDNVLTLSFKFSFHKKRAEDIKHISLISEIVSNYANVQPTVQVLLDEKTSDPKNENDYNDTIGLSEIQNNDAVSTEPDPAHASLIASVQDIMGGGEIVDAGTN